MWRDESLEVAVSQQGPGAGTEGCVVALLTGPPEHDQAFIAEMMALADAAGLAVRGLLSQDRMLPEPSTYFGSGKVLEIKAEMERLGVDLLVVGGELSPAQSSRLEDKIEGRVIDRTELILDIFAQRARSAEGRLQVEVAQLRWRIPRLRGLGKHLSRLGGGIGTRGPGETKLESDRQAIMRRLRVLEGKLGPLATRRRTARQSRPYPQVALLGYTNAGKTTLLRRLADDVPAGENRLFATLDPLTRMVRLPSGHEVLLIDTVGFVRDLPHTLVAAFRATLEEVRQADVWIKLFDGEGDPIARQEGAIDQVLREIQAEPRPTLRVLNKADVARAPGDDDLTPISALTGLGIPELLARLEMAVAESWQEVEWLIPFQRGDLLAQLHGAGRVVAERHEAAGTVVRAAVTPGMKAYLDGELGRHDA